MDQLITKSYSGTIQDLDEKKGIVTVGACTFGNVDTSKDISLKGSFTKTINEGFSRVRWFLNHDRGTLLGVPLEASQTEEMLVVKGKINLNKQVGRDTYEDYKIYADEGKSLDHSIGAYAIKSRKNDRGEREVSEWRWMEYSTLTDWGANENTPLISLKSALSESSPEDAIIFLEMCLKKANYSDEKGKSIEKQIDTLKALISQPSKNTEEPPVDYRSIILNNFKINS